MTSLAARLAAAQASVTSSQMSVSMSIAASFPGEPPVAMDDVPFMTLTEVGDLARAELDMGAFMAGMSGAADPGSEMPPLPSLEMILDGDTGFYLKLESLAALDAALDPMGPSPWPEDLLAEHGGDVGDLWGFVDLTSTEAAEILAPLGVTPQAALQDDLLDLLTGGLPEGALLEARMGGATALAGIPVQEYSFLLDLAALSEMPDTLGMLLGPNQGGPSPEGDLLGGPLPVEYVVHVDSGDLIRQIVAVVDIGAMLTQMFDAFALDEGLPEGAEADLPDFEYVMSMRMDVVALNDPSLAVELPDPLLVVDLADLFPGVGAF